MDFEIAITGSLLSVNGDCPKNLARLLRFAPESFDDQRCGQTVKAIAQLRAEGCPVHPLAVGERLTFHAFAFVMNAEFAALPIDAAEHEAEPVWKKFQSRRTASLFSEAADAITADPERAADIRARVVSEAQRLDCEQNGTRPEDRIFDAANPPPEPTTVFWIGTTGVCTAGNITTVSAQSKHGKSAAIGAMLAATFAGDNCLGFKSGNPQGRAVIAIDTEQSPFDHYQLIKRSIARAGAQNKPAWLLPYCLTGFKADEIRRSIRSLLQSAAKKFGGVLAMLIDGVADAVIDVNDPAEANAFVAELHALAIEFNCAIVAVIHLNPGSDFKTRGHLGSQLERKAETNLKLDKDADEIVTVFADKNRRAPISKATGPRFAWNHEHGMHVSVASQRAAKADANKRDMEILAEAVFSAAGKPSLRYKELVSFVMSEIDKSEPTAKRRVDDMIDTKVIRKEVAGFYALNT